MALRALRIVQFIMLVLLAVLLIPLGAHVFELPGKIGLDRAAYLTVQRIYLGWSLFGIAEIAAFAAALLLMALLRRQAAPFCLAGATAACIAAAIVIFLLLTLPVNQATRNWAFAPPNWQTLRRQWEFSHLASALLVFTGFCTALLSTLLSGGGREPHHYLGPSGTRQT